MKMGRQASGNPGNLEKSREMGNALQQLLLAVLGPPCDSVRAATTSLFRKKEKGKKKKKNSDASSVSKKKESDMDLVRSCFCARSQERKSICFDWLIANICYCWQYCAREKWAFELWIPMRPFLLPGTIYCISSMYVPYRKPSSVIVFNLTSRF